MIPASELKVDDLFQDISFRITELDSEARVMIAFGHYVDQYDLTRVDPNEGPTLILIPADHSVRVYRDVPFVE